MKLMRLTTLAIGLIFFAQSAQADWTPAKRITWAEYDSTSPAVAVDSNDHIHVVWQDDKEGFNYIYYKQSLDGGATWSVTKRISADNIDYVRPAIAIDSSDRIHVVWQSFSASYNHAIFYRRSTDGGAAWSAIKTLSGSAPTERYSPAIAVDSGNTVHVVWSDFTPYFENYPDGSSEIYYAKSTTGGTTWSLPKRLTWSSLWCYDPAIAIDAGNSIHIFWSMSLAGNDEIYGKRSTDGGATWSSSKRLSWTSSDSWASATAIDSNKNIYVVWYEWTPSEAQVYYKRSTDGGATWSAAKRLSWASGGSYVPSIAIDSSNTVYVVWANNAPGNYEIYYRRTTNGGSSWSPAQRLTSTPGGSGSPVIAMDSSDTAHIVWSDESPGNYELYYKKGK